MNIPPERIIDELYSAFLQLFKYKQNDLIYNGCIPLKDDKDEEGYSLDFFGHYFEINGVKYMANVENSISKFGYNDISEIGSNAEYVDSYAAQIFKTDHSMFVYDNVSYTMTFTFDKNTGNLLDLFDLEKRVGNKMKDLDCNYLFTSNSKQFGKFLYEPYVVERNFKYITEGFHCSDIFEE